MNEMKLQDNSWAQVQRMSFETNGRHPDMYMKCTTDDKQWNHRYITTTQNP